MCPYRDIFIEYVDLTHQKRIVRLGDENKVIPIKGIGTICIQIREHNIAYKEVLHVPALTAILLSSRGHRRITQGCSFIADHSGCFLTFPEFTIEIDDHDDCTIACGKGNPQKLDFDSRLYLDQNTTPEYRRLAINRAIQQLHIARNAKYKDELDADDEMMAKLDTAINSVPCYSRVESGRSSIEKVSEYELKKMFGSRSLAQWKLLEQVGTAFKHFENNKIRSRLVTFLRSRATTKENYWNVLRRPYILSEWTLAMVRAQAKVDSAMPSP